MDPFSILITFLSVVVAGFFAGLLGSLTGLGGGTVLVPVLTLFLGIPIIFATGASLISTIATSAGSASGYTKSKIANIRVAIGLEVATTTGAIVGSLTLISVNKLGYIWIIYVIFGVVLLVSLLPTINRASSELPKEKKPDWTTRFFNLYGTYYDQRLKKQVNYHGIRWWLGEIVMFFAGFISGLLGIGSGALKVLGMDWAMNLPMKVTTTSSNFMIGITAATGSSIYWFAGYIQPFLAAATAVGVLVGAFLGSKLLIKITNVNIRWIFFWVLAFLGVDMIFSGFLRRGLKPGQTVNSYLNLIGFIVSIVVSIILLGLLYYKIKRERRMNAKTRAE